MPPSSPSATMKNAPISHGTTITLALLGALLVSGAGVVANYVTTQADVRYQGRDLEQLKIERRGDQAQIFELSGQIRVLTDRVLEQRVQLNRIEGKIDNSSPRRVSSTQP